MAGTMVELVEKTPPSCSECRKAKRKCDRGRPCNACIKSRSTCVYERIIRTPLTRAYLSEVESELARTQALLSRYQSQATDHTTTPSPVSRQGEHLNNQSIPIENHEPNHDVSTSSYVLESPPAGELDWDERAVASSAVNDGMASLLDRNGYMGPTSGSALLRLADNGDSDQQLHTNTHEATPYIPALTPSLYTLGQLEPFVDAYFATYHISYPIVHEPTFRAQFMEIIPRPHGQAWQVLLYIISAIGSFTAAETAPEIDVGLFEATKQRLSIDMLETGNLTLVQSFTLISNYIQKRNRPNAGYVYMSLAKRMAWGLGLHKEFPAWREQPFRMEVRRRVWHSLIVFDVGAIITFSRPLDLPSSGIDVGLPMNINDSDLTSSTSKLPEERECTTLYTHVRVQSTFHQATNSIYEKLISTLPSAQEMIRLDQVHLQGWINSMPSFYNDDAVQSIKFRLSHAIMRWRWRNFRILMMRPYLMRRCLTLKQDPNNESESHQNPSEDIAINTCLVTAKETIRLIYEYWRTQHQNVMTCWYGLYFLFQATLIPVISLRNQSRSELAPSWRDDILLALETITDMSRLNPAAIRCHSVIINLCGSYLAMDPSQWESPTNESPQTQMNTLYSYMFGPVVDDQLFDAQNLQMQDASFLDFMGQLGAP